MSGLRVGVIGLGFIGQTHLRAYESARLAGMPVSLAAVCDRNAERLTGTASTAGNIGSSVNDQLFDPGLVQTFTDPYEFFATADMDLVSICTHTESHVPFAIEALKAGKHVLVEKPIAGTASAVRSLADYLNTETASGKLCMPAMCMRFWPAWAWLKDTIDSMTHGAVRSATFARLGSTPTWSDGFYKSQSSSGGALLDLHIHDTDFIHHCFGVPDSVTSTGDANHLTTSYNYSDSPIHVTAEGCWDRAPAAPYEMRFTVCFERATAVFNLNAEHQLVVHTETDSSPIELPTCSGWDMQVRALIEAIQSGRRTPPVTIKDAYEVMQTIEAERRSLTDGTPVMLSSHT